MHKFGAVHGTTGDRHTLDDCDVCDTQTVCRAWARVLQSVTPIKKTEIDPLGVIS